MEGSSSSCWSLRVGSLVSRGDVDDVEELFVANPGRRWRPTAAATEHSAKPALPSRMHLSAPRVVPSDVGTGGKEESALRSRFHSSDWAADAGLLDRVLGRLLEDNYGDRLRALLAAWRRVAAIAAWRLASSAAFPPPSSSAAASSAPPPSHARVRGLAVADRALRLGLSSAGRHPGATAAVAGGALLRLVLLAFHAAVVVARDAETAERRRLRCLRFGCTSRALSGWRSEVLRLELTLLLRVWRGCLARPRHRQEKLGLDNSPLAHTILRAWLAWARPRVHGHRRSSAACSLLARRDMFALLHESLMRWRTFIADALAVQVLVMRERLGRADAECCALRGEDKRLRSEAEQLRSQDEQLRGEVEQLRYQDKLLRAEAELLRSEAEKLRLEAEGARANCVHAEDELLRRSRHEFAQLREVEAELAQLRLEAASSLVPKAKADAMLTVANADSRTAAATTASVAGMAATSVIEANSIAVAPLSGLAAAFARALVRDWARVCLAAWHALAGAQELTLELVEQWACTDARLRTLRALAAWRIAVERVRLRAWSLRLADATHAQHADFVTRAVLRSWPTSTDRISQLVTPLSLKGSCTYSPISEAANYHSVVARSLADSLGESDISRIAQATEGSSFTLGTPRRITSSGITTLAATVIGTVASGTRDSADDERPPRRERVEWPQPSPEPAIGPAVAGAGGPQLQQLAMPQRTVVARSAGGDPMWAAQGERSDRFRLDSVVERLIDGWAVENLRPV